MKKVAFYTLGCKVNQYETEAMLEMFEKEGYEQVSNEDYADVYVINTCTVTHMSDRKSRQYVRRMRKKNPDAIIAVVGCYSQVSPEEILEIDEVNLVMGTNERRDIVKEIKKLGKELPYSKEKQELTNNLFCWNNLYFAIYDCFELADVNYRSNFKSEVDMIIACEWNRDIDYRAFL